MAIRAISKVKEQAQMLRLGKERMGQCSNVHKESLDAYERDGASQG